MKFNMINRSALLLALLAAAACNRAPKSTKTDTPNEGRIRIAGDESFRAIINSTISTYEDAYKKTHFDTTFTSETEAIQMVLKDSARIAVSTRKFTDEEKKYFESKTIRPTEVLYAYDAVAVIVNTSNPDTVMSMQRLKAILAGEETTWKAGSMKGQLIVPVLDDANSSNANWLRTKLGLSQFSRNSASAGRHAAVVQYVKNNPTAIGFIGVGLVSDVDNPKARAFRQDIRLVALSEKEPATDTNSYQPYQAYLKLNTYPLRREVYLLSGEYHTGLGTGFINWATSDKGQLIVLKSGLFPATVPVRIREFKK